MPKIGRNVAVTLSQKDFDAFGQKLGPNSYGKKQATVLQLIRQYTYGELSLPPPPPPPPVPSPFVDLATRFETECRNPELLESIWNMMARHVGVKKKFTKIV